MDINSIGLFESKETIQDIEELLILEFQFSNSELTMKDISKVLNKFNLKFMDCQKQELVNYVNSLGSFSIQGYVDLEAYNEGRYHLILQGFPSYEKAFFAIEKDDFSKYEYLKIRTEDGEQSSTFTEKEYQKEKINLLFKILFRMGKIQKYLREVSTKISSLPKMKNHSSLSFDKRDIFLHKTDLIDIINSDLIFDENNKKIITEILEKDQISLDKKIEEFKNSSGFKSLINLKKNVEQSLNNLNGLFNEYNGHTFISYFNGFTLSEEEKVIANKVISEVKCILVKDHYNGKYIIFSDNDVRDKIQEKFKSYFPESNQNLKSRMEVIKKDMASFLYQNRENLKHELILFEYIQKFPFN